MSFLLIFSMIISLSFIHQQLAQEISITTKIQQVSYCHWDYLKKNPSKYFCKKILDNYPCDDDITNTSTTFDFGKKSTLPAPILLCKDDDIIGFYTTFLSDVIYIIETQDELKNNSWTYSHSVYCNGFTIKNLTNNLKYRVRLWAISPSNVLYGPSLPSDWITTWENTNGDISLKFTNITIAEESNTIGGDLVWEITENGTNTLSCTYELITSGDDFSCRYYQKYEYPKNEFKFHFSEISLEYPCLICIENDYGKFCDYFPNNSSIVGLPVIINITEIQYNLNDYNRTYDITVSLETLENIPDYYIIAIQSEDDVYVEKRVDGNTTSVTFKHVPFKFLYEAVATACYEDGRNSTATYSFRLPVPKFININVGLIIFVSGTLFLVFFSVLYITCVRLKKLKVERRKREAISDYYEYRKNIAGMYTIVENDMPIFDYSDKWELEPRNIVIGKVLGEGAFGIVRKGYLNVENGSIPIAIKMLKDFPSSDDLKEFQREIEIMKTVGSHPHLVSLIGICSWKEKRKPLLVVEFCAKGDLQSYLRFIWRKLNGYSLKIEDCKNFPYVNGGEVSNKLYEIEENLKNDGLMLKPIDLISFARQIALGMEYLSGLRLLHRDLATRNVLVCEDNSVKVADFGLSRDVYQNNVYRKSGGGKLPLKWMAIESLTHQQYTTQSDVWSYGILLWEIVTLGGFPYPDVPTQSLLKYLESGHRMSCPANCSPELYQLMSSCWKFNPKERPNFTEIVKYLDTLLENQTSYIKIGEE